jgi:hypothetical protein
MKKQILITTTYSNSTKGLDMKNKFTGFLLLAVMLFCLGAESQAAEQDFEEGKLYVRVERYLKNRENPLHCEFIVNGQTVDIFTTETYAKIDQFIKEGWNDITIRTVPQEPANDDNHLEFKIGPMHKDSKDAKRKIMSPVVWQFNNGTDWEFAEGQFTHALGPDVKQVTLNYHFYWAGVAFEARPIQKGDYILSVKPYLANRNSPVIATVQINGTPFSSFQLAERRLNITSLLKPGKNEVKIVSHRVKDSIEENDIECFIGGPAEWSVGERKYIYKPITEFKAMQGWKRNDSTGQLMSPSDPKAEMIGRTIVFMVNDPLPNQEPKSGDPEAPAEKAADQADKFRSI